MRLAHVYVAADREQSTESRHAPDSTPEQFEETMHYGADAKALTSQQAFHARFEGEPWINELHAELRKLLSPERKTLGLGSGFGEHELRFVQLGYDITASDVVEEPLRLTASLFPEFRYRRLDVFEPRPAETWDDVLITGMDSYFDDTRAQLLFRRVADLLRGPGAEPKRLIFVLRYHDNVATKLIDAGVRTRASLLNARRLWRGGASWLPRAHGFRRSNADIRALATKAGFEPRRMAQAGFGVELCRLAILTKVDGWFGGALTRLDRHLRVLNNCTITEFILKRS